MQRNVIVIVSEEVEVFGNFKKMCLIKGLPYHYLKRFKMPIDYKGIQIQRQAVK